MKLSKLLVIPVVFSIGLSVSSCDSPFLDGTPVYPDNRFTFPAMYNADLDDVVIIRNFDEIQELITDVETQEYYYYESDHKFVDFLREYKVEYFETYILVLGNHWEGSGSIGVHFMGLRIHNEELVCHIERTIPNIGTADMKHWPFGFDIKKSYEFSLGRFEYHNKESLFGLLDY